VGDCYDNSIMESFWGTLQLEPLDTRQWRTRDELANAIFGWIECRYNPYRRHSSIEMHTPVTFDTLHTGQTKTTDPPLQVSELQGEPHPRNSSLRVTVPPLSGMTWDCHSGESRSVSSR
jgi:hypothetical protein